MESVTSILKSRSLPDREFEKISAMVYDICRINLHDGKKELVQARLNKRLRKLGMDSYKEYIRFLEEDKTGAELSAMVDILTTNLTYFFREPDHFKFLRDEILKKLPVDKSVRYRIWCAGCASGEEAYTLALVIEEALKEHGRADVKILASDISAEVLAQAREGVFVPQRLRDMPDALIKRYFQKIQEGEGAVTYKVALPLRQYITFRRLNLMDAWPMKGPFDVIFCRNVMIYFDKQTQGELVSRFHDMLSPGGYFFVGHSESLTNVRHNFDYVKPSIYQKKQ